MKSQRTPSTSMKIETRYKFLRTGMKSQHGDMKWRMNKWYKHEGDLELYNSGFHCSKGIYQAFSYVQGEILALVEVRGDHKKGSDKQVWSEMRVIKRWRWQKRDSVLFSIYAARLCLENFESVFPDDRRPREAIKAAEVYTKNPTAKNKAAAWSAAESAWSAVRSAAWSAAWSAARSARSAAWSARSAAWSAESAWSAVRSAWSAVRSAESGVYKKLDKWMLNHLPELKEI